MTIILRDKDTRNGNITGIITTETSTVEDIENAIATMKKEVEDYSTDYIEEYLPKDAIIEFVDTDIEVWW